MLDSVFRLATQHKLWAHRRSSFQGWYLRSSLFRQCWGKNKLWFKIAYVPYLPNQTKAVHSSWKGQFGERSWHEINFLYFRYISWKEPLEMKWNKSNIGVGVTQHFGRYFTSIFYEYVASCISYVSLIWKLSNEACTYTIYVERCTRITTKA